MRAVKILGWFVGYFSLLNVAFQFVAFALLVVGVPFPPEYRVLAGTMFSTAGATIWVRRQIKSGVFDD